MKVWLSAVMALLMTGAAHADEIQEYKSYDQDTGTLAATITRRVTTLDENTVQVILDWASTADSATGWQLYVMNSSLETIRWEIKHPDEETDYVGTRDGNVLHLRGTLRGKTIDRDHEIDSKPFYFNPSIGLQEFARSGNKKMKFWTLRPDNLSKYTMKAEKKGLEPIEMSGEPVNAVRVKWGLTGLRSKFFSQTLWFRASDGLFVRSKPSRGEWSELVREESP